MTRLLRAATYGRVRLRPDCRSVAATRGAKMSIAESASAAPVTSAARVGELDVLRGFALLGVLVVNLVSWMGYPWFATEMQADALNAGTADTSAEFLVRWLGGDKANTLFAFLFGVGFWVQMERLEGRGSNFQRIYMRRLFVLLVFGLVHLLVFWPYDILHLYALTGFILLAMRRFSDRVFLLVGLVLALAARPLINFLLEETGVRASAFKAVLNDTAILERYNEPSLLGLSSRFFDVGAFGWIGGGFIIATLFYVLGRFLLGAYVARRGWIQRSAELLAGWRRCALICLPLGLVGQFFVAAISLETWAWTEQWQWAEDWVHYPTLLLLAAGYVSTLILIFHSRAKPLAMVFAPVGRMALTNYVMQTFIIGFLAYKSAGGPALAGNTGDALLVAIAFAVFAAQTVFSHLWLSRFAYGPLEWVWRALTYGEAPRMRRATPPSPSGAKKTTA